MARLTFLDYWPEKQVCRLGLDRVQLSFYLQYFLLRRTRARSAQTFLAHTGTYAPTLKAVGTCDTLYLSTNSAGFYLRRESPSSSLAALVTAAAASVSRAV